MGPDHFNQERERRNILVTGTPRVWHCDAIRRARRLGLDLADYGFALTAGAYPGVDRAVSEAYCARAREHGMNPAETFTQLREPFKLWSWRLVASGYDAGASLRNVPQREWLNEALKCDAALMVGGRGFALEIAQAFLDRGKPVFPVPFSPGRADLVFQQILRTWCDTPVPGLTRNQFLRLSLPWTGAHEPVTDLLIGALTTHPDIFISYRRADGGWVAGRLQSELADYFGSHRVFSDVTHLRGGDSWSKAIDETIAHARVGLVIIGKDWLNPRLQEEDDVLRREITKLLEDAERTVIVVTADAEPPEARQLPEALKRLAAIQAINVTHRDWQKDFEKVLSAVRSALRPSPPRRPDQNTRSTTQ